MLQGIEQTYQDVDKLLCKLSWDAARRYGIEFEECKAQANKAFVLAYRKFDPSKHNKFLTYLYHVVYNRIWDLSYYRPDRWMTMEAGDQTIQARTRESSRLETMQRDLSDDARTLLQLVIETPGDLKSLAKAEPVSMRRMLRSYLASLGWKTSRILESFSELKEALD